MGAKQLNKRGGVGGRESSLIRGEGGGGVQRNVRWEVGGGGGRAI